jgi:hypothetical protein
MPLVQEQVGEIVAERQWDTDQERADDENRKRPFAHQPERVQSQHIFDRDLVG